MCVTTSDNAILRASTSFFQLKENVMQVTYSIFLNSFRMEQSASEAGNSSEANTQALALLNQAGKLSAGFSCDRNGSLWQSVQLGLNSTGRLQEAVVFQQSITLRFDLSLRIKILKAESPRVYRRVIYVILEQIFVEKQTRDASSEKQNNSLRIP